MRRRRLVVTMLAALALPGAHPLRAAPNRGRSPPPPRRPPAATSTGSVILPPGGPAAVPPGSPPVRRRGGDPGPRAEPRPAGSEAHQSVDSGHCRRRSAVGCTPRPCPRRSPRHRDSPAGNIFAGGDVVTDRFLQDSVEVVQQVPWRGGQYTARWNGQRSSTTSIFTSFNPRLSSNLSLNYTQPLLRNFGIDGPRQRIAVTRANRDLSDIDLRRTVVSTERTVRNAYWQLVFARSFLEVQRQSLALAEESLRNNRTRVEVGTMAPIRHRRGGGGGREELRGGDSGRGGRRARRRPAANPDIRPRHPRLLVDEPPAQRPPVLLARGDRRRRRRPQRASEPDRPRHPRQEPGG